MNKKFIIGVLVVVIAGSAFFLGKSDLLQGKIKTVKIADTVQNIKPYKPRLLSPENGSFENGPGVSLKWEDGGDPDNFPQKKRNYRWKLKEYGGDVIWQRDWHDPAGGSTACNPIDSQPYSWTCTDVVVPNGLLKAGHKYLWSVEAGDGKVGSGYTVNSIFLMKPQYSFTLLTKHDPQVTSGMKKVELKWKDNTAIKNGSNSYTIYRLEKPISLLNEKGPITTLGPIADLKPNSSGYFEFVDQFEYKKGSFYYVVIRSTGGGELTGMSNEVQVKLDLEKTTPIF